MNNEICSYCGHSLENNSHGIDQNDCFIDENDNLIHSGYCTYCKKCYELSSIITGK